MPSQLKNTLDAIQASLEAQDKVLEKLDHAINGNGSPGLKITVDRHEQSLKWLQRVGWAVLAPVLAALGVGLLTLTQKLESPNEVSPPRISPPPQPSPGPGVQPVPSRANPVFSSSK